MSQISYKRTQTGWILLTILPLAIVYMYISYYFQWGDEPLTQTSFFIISSVFLLVLLVFYNLTIYIEDKVIHAKFGIGLIHVKLPIEKLHEVSIIRTPWWYGWGVRFTPQGMLYNIYGRQAVKVNFTGKGKTKNVLLGSPEPEELLKHINQLK